jgi:hypothetical protein
MMETQLPFTILPQPTETTCGPTCLHAIYNYYNDTIPLQQVIGEVHELDEGGTLDVFLACHALRRGYKATIFTYNLQMFDPTWFNNSSIDFADKLRKQAVCKTEPKLRVATRGYLEYLELGGTLRLKDLSASLIRKYLKKGIPILTGLSATYLHRAEREKGILCEPDDECGYAQGHFVVLYGYNRPEKRVYVAEPLHPNPIAASQYYSVRLERLICSILLGILTYDANLLIIERNEEEGSHGKPHHSEQP